MNQILDDIRSAIASLDAKPEKANVGTVVELADGVAKVDGLSGSPTAWRKSTGFPAR